MIYFIDYQHIHYTLDMICICDFIQFTYLYNASIVGKLTSCQCSSCNINASNVLCSAHICTVIPCCIIVWYCKGVCSALQRERETSNAVKYTNGEGHMHNPPPPSVSVVYSASMQAP